MSEDVVEVPDGLSAEEAAEFIRQRVIAAGLDPDSAHVLSVDLPEAQPVQMDAEGRFVVQFSYAVDKSD